VRILSEIWQRLSIVLRRFALFGCWLTKFGPISRCSDEFGHFGRVVSAILVKIGNVLIEQFSGSAGSGVSAVFLVRFELFEDRSFSVW
jgi:hypothetical protein